MKKKIIKALEKIKVDELEKNFKILNRKFDINNLLNELVTEDYNESYSLLAIESILSNIDFNQNVNNEEFKNDKNFVFLCLSSNHGDDFKLGVLRLALKYKMNVNITDIFGDTLLHRILKQDYYFKDMFVLEAYSVLSKYNYDIFILNNEYKSILDIAKENNISKDFIEIYKKDRNKLLPLKIEEKTNEIDKIINDSFTDFSSYLHKCNLLYNVSTQKYDRKIILKLLEHIFNKGISPNSMDIFKDSFIHNLIENDIDKDFIYKVIELSTKYKLDVNEEAGCKRSVNYMENLIMNNHNKGKITPIFKLLIANGFKDICLIDEKLDHLALSNKEYIEDLEVFLDEYKNYKNNNIVTNNKKTNDNNLHIDFNNKFILYGVKEKTYTLNNVKDYLINNCNQNIYYTSVNDIISNCQLISGLKENLIKIMKDCVTNNKVLMLEEIDKLYRPNITDEEKEELDILLLYYIEKKHLKIIATCDIKNMSLFEKSILSIYMQYKKIKENNEEINLIINKLIDEKIELDSDLKEIINEKIQFILMNDKIKKLEDVSDVKIVINILNNVKKFIKTINDYRYEIDKKELSTAIVYALKKCNYIHEESKENIKNELIKIKEDKIIKKLNK